jgi:hypothetical protein
VAQHRFHEAIDGLAVNPGRANQFAVAQHGDTVAVLEHGVEEVRDVDDRPPGLLQGVHHIMEFRRLVRRQG